MDKQAIRDYCAAKPGAEWDYKAEWGAERCLVCGKMFVMLGGDKAGTPIVSLKCEPALARVLREQYADIIPGYYMNKEHWNSVYYERGTVPDDELRRLMDLSYDLITAKLTKTQKAQLGL